ncbi:hypothetical protein O3M35_007210 [Rhynocoris fuscipes]|uniref:FERM domain-containing protein n=1 Tax=Rhynocoris fuscipes TaxID=488301 RepID=A0AAW1D976_9HEMI
MRVGVAGPYHSIPQGTPQPCSRYLKVHLLVGNPLYFLVEPKSRTKELYTELCSYLKGQGMLDTDLFGLSLLLGKFYFLLFILKNNQKKNPLKFTFTSLYY